MAYNVIIQPQAELELDDAYNYYDEQKIGLGFDFLEQFVDVLEILENNPFLFQKIDGEKRRAFIRKFDYNVIFVIKGNEVFILAIMHGSRSPKRWSERK